MLRQINTLQYLGSKSRLLEDICTPILSERHIRRAVDLFAGTGSVGLALSDRLSVISNDIEYYAYVLNLAVLRGCAFSDANFARLWDAVGAAWRERQSALSEALDWERAMLELGDEDYEVYARYSADTPSVFNPSTQTEKMRALEALVRRVEPGRKRQEALPDDSVDLILTDPPYMDQVPYLEYSQLWNDIFRAEDDLEAELVVSDAPSRNKTKADFNRVFEAIIARSARALKPMGYFIMFYHTFDLQSWSDILATMNRSGLRYCYQIPVSAPRKSFKTVMSPKSTLEGNYVLFFRKERMESVRYEGTAEDAARLATACARRIIAARGGATSQELYDGGMLKEAFEQGYLSILAGRYRSFIDIIRDEFVCEAGVWREK